MVAIPELVSEEQLRKELRQISVFSDLSEETIDWVLAHAHQATYATGDILSEEGTVPDKMSILLEGEIRAQQEKGIGDGRVYTARAGMVVGILPYSRLTIWPLTARATAPTRGLWISKDDFPEMIATLPTLVSRLVGIMSDRIRETVVEQQQRDKLLSLGQLSAGLAHELNNPAAAAQRSAAALRESMKAMRQAHLRLQSRELSVSQRAFLAKVAAEWDDSSCVVEDLTAFERLALEDSFGAWLEAHGVGDGWMLAPSLVEGSCTIAMLDEIAQHFSGVDLADALAKLSASFTISRLLVEIENSTKRISSLVKAVKEYSYMDQAPEQDINIHDTLEATLAILQNRLVDVEVSRDYDLSLPTLCAYGVELNQVWTNLIHNAVDAMGGRGKLTIRTRNDFGKVLVEICDTGRGIPAEIHNRIFDPFFTTKKVGDGTGLGLDAVFRIVKKHEGSVRFDSKPGDTRFQVYLPFVRAGRADV